MSVTRTPTVEPDVQFQVDIPITKAFVDTATGKRYIVGVATGVAADRDGERMSRSAVVDMVRQVHKGGVKLTTGHQQDWWSEIGDAIGAEHDQQTDELILKTELPPEGVDPLADKAWRTANTEQVGFSVGGKLLKSFFERDDLGKKRKVLDAIGLRHFALTKSPAYANSFAEAVAKTWDGEEPADDEFTLDVEKDTTTGSWASGDSDGGGGRDSVGSGQRNSGSRKPGQKGMRTDDDGDDRQDDDQDDDKDLPKASDERHLACPNCGHEFAADLPVDSGDRQPDEKPNDEDDDQDTGKSLKETIVSKLSDTLDALKALADEEPVTKTDPEVEVEKTATEDHELSDVEKAVAASHRAHEQRFEDLETQVSGAFELVAKSFKALQEQIADMPLGRKSVARVHPDGNGTPANIGHEHSEVEKTSDDGTAGSELKRLNAGHPAYAQYS